MVRVSLTTRGAFSSPRRNPLLSDYFPRITCGEISIPSGEPRRIGGNSRQFGGVPHLFRGLPPEVREFEIENRNSPLYF